MLNKDRLRRVTAVILMVCLVFTGPVVSRAATESASNLNELAKIVRDHGVKRDSKFSVRYKGSMDDVEILLNNMTDNLFFFSKLNLYDDPSTSDDADYLTANIQLFNDTVDVDLDDNFDLNEYTIKFNIRYFETLPETQYVNSHVPQILSELDVSSKSNYEKVKAIHDYVCDLITYYSGDEDWASSMYGALTEKKALCNAYSLCMYKLLVEAGVPCKYIGGKAGTGSHSAGHAWNIVALGDKWYYLDATWDDFDDENTWDYAYFLKGSSDFDSEDPDQVHILDKPYTSNAFKKAFPMAKTAFKEGMNDENVSVKIGSDPDSSVEPTEPDEPDESTKKYTLKDLIYDKWPTSGKISVKKGKTEDLLLFVKKDMKKLVKKVTYKFTTGKSRVKSVEAYNLSKSTYSDGYVYMLSFKGKKKGAVKVKISLKLKNGQTLSYTFKGKVK